MRDLDRVGGDGVVMCHVECLMPKNGEWGVSDPTDDYSPRFLEAIPMVKAKACEVRPGHFLD